MNHNPFLQESMNNNMYFNHLINNISNKMYCAANNNLIYPSFQNNVKTENYGNATDFNDMTKFPKKKAIEENNTDLFNNFSNINNKNLVKNTYMKKINSLFNQDSLKIMPENNQFLFNCLISHFINNFIGDQRNQLRKII